MDPDDLPSNKELVEEDGKMEGDLIENGEVEVDLHGKVEVDLPEDDDLTEGISPDGDLMEDLPQDKQLVEDQIPDDELAGTITLEEPSSNNGMFNIVLTFQVRLTFKHKWGKEFSLQIVCLLSLLEKNVKVLNKIKSKLLRGELLQPQM